ncbi:MAG: L-threonylcarbamoyladenylate synthase [Candidatus Binatales bacterium]
MLDKALDQAVDRAVEALRRGELVVYPTETLYALGADAASPAALRRLFAAKAREAGKPVALIAADPAMGFAIARDIPGAARRLAKAFWPGPLTLVMPAKAGLPESLVGADGGVGVRVSSHPIAHALARRLGRPITATSANPAGQPPSTTIEQARAAFGRKVKVYLEGGELGGSPPSTVVAFDREAIKVLRAGAIPRRRLEAALTGAR